MVKNEWIKLFRNRIFLVFFAAVFVFYGFYLYWSLVFYEKQGLMEKAPERYYNELAGELSALSLTDGETLVLLTERIGQMEELKGVMAGSAEFERVLAAHEEVRDEVDRTVHYQEIRANIINNAEKQIRRLDRGNYGTLEQRYLESWMRKTQEVYARLSDVTPVFCHARGLQALVDNPMADFCCLFILLLAVFQLLTVERQNELIILSKSTVRGKRTHGFVKAAVLGGVCILVSVLLLFEGIFIAGRIYPFPPLDIPIQSVYSYCTLRINVLEYLCLYMLLKILFYLACTALIYFICCVLHKVIPIFLAILAGGGILLFLYLGIAETSYLAPLRAASLVALGQAGALLERYQCVNLFGIAVNRTLFAVILLCALTILFLAAAVRSYAVSGEKHIWTDRRSVYDKKKRWSVSLTAHECYKVFFSQKLIFVLAAAAVVSAFYLPVTGTVGGITLVDHLFWVYSLQVEGEYTDEVMTHIRRCQEETAASAARPDVQENERMFYDAMMETYSKMEEYAAYLSEHENSYYINNPAYEMLTGADEGANRKNILTAMLMYAFAIVCFVLTMAIDYQRGENRLIHSTKEGRWHYVRAKVFVGMLISLVLLSLFFVPQMVRELHFYGTDYIFAPAYSLPHLSRIGKGISIFTYLSMEYVGRYLLLLAVMAFSYLVERKVKSSIVAIVCVCAVVEIPLAAMLLA